MSASATITVGEDVTTIAIAELQYSIPRGSMSLHRAHITADPPLPQDLTNAIGDMLDHLDDASRDMPSLADAASVVLAGPTARAMAAVEFGGTVDAAEFALSRTAAEDVFRTLATEQSSERRHNPGLPADLVETIPAGCCAVVALFRGLHLDSVTVTTR